MIKQDIFENQVKKVFLAIGSNMGNRFQNIELAKIKLSNNKIKILKSSSFYETLSWPNENNPKFLNIVLKVETNLQPLNLLDLCKKIETSLGRKKSRRNSPRTCDIDILDYDKKNVKNGINLPHPRMHVRNFVLIPLFEIAPYWIHPKTYKSIKKLIFSIPIKDITTIKYV